VLGAKVGKKGAGVVGSSVGIKLSDMVGRKTESLSILASSPPVELWLEDSGSLAKLGSVGSSPL